MKKVKTLTRFGQGIIAHIHDSPFYSYAQLFLDI